MIWVIGVLVSCLYIFGWLMGFAAGYSKWGKDANR